MLRPLTVVGVLAFASFVLAGCKQDVGERCEQGSDCSSGYCGGEQGGEVSVQGRVCTNGPEGAMILDAATPADTATAADARPDAAADGVDASEVGDGAGEGHATDASDGAREAPASEGGNDAELDLGTEAATGDGAADVSPEAASGG